MRRLPLQRARGQALVEGAIGVTLFVTILLLGIHFAEVGALSLKAQEATANAVFDSTGRRIQTPGQAPTGQQGLPQAAAGMALGRYGDFDGRSTANGGTTVLHALTSGQNLQVQCETPGAVAQLAGPSQPAVAALADTGEVSCVAAVRIDAPGVPQNFLNGGETALFKNEQRGALNMVVCGVGRATNGTCQGRVGILLNDWALAGEAGGEAADCRLGNCTNLTYRNAVQTVFAANGGPGLVAGATMAQALAGAAPTSAANFHMSFAGRESGHEDGLPGHTANAGPYNTGGPGAGTLATHPQTAAPCFLGMPGCN